MIKILKLILITFGGLLLLFTSLQSLSVESSIGKPVQPTTQVLPSPTPLSFEKLPNIDDLPLRDNPDIYKSDDPGSVVTMYVTVRKGNVSDNTDYTWDEVNSFTKVFDLKNGIPPIVGKAEAILQIGDENGLLAGELGYGVVVPNATINIRGYTTSLARQKGYKIELLSDAGTWRGQSTIDLNKHPYDRTRVKNKLNFDLLKQIPNMTSLRTQFVHLYVKDETTETGDKTFVDYGLFTQIEQPNNIFLKAHLLDPEGQLYKATFFEFFRYKDIIRMVDDPLYDATAFSKIFEVKGNNDHSKLIQMLDDLNNYDLPIEQTFVKYFDSDNYFTWLAYNILVGNVDTQSQNFYLYSPHNGNKWYFLPWDYDGAFPMQDRAVEHEFIYAPWENGVSNYWGVILTNRLLRFQKYRQMLDDKINELRIFLTPERIKNMLDVYKKAVDPYVTRMPDLKNLGNSLKTRDLDFELMPGEILTNYDMYLESLKKPMPFYLGTPKVDTDGQLAFDWDESYDFNGQDITYDFVVGEDPEFKNIVSESKLTNLIDIKIDMLKPGTYFWRVIATNASGEFQIPFDNYVDTKSKSYFGIKYLLITPDDEVQE
ncbi:MAG: CotH kinase family protein [Chloroflexi bacterium]|nr:CotH kinase family protein [Chloroflexota bacterium]